MSGATDNAVPRATLLPWAAELGPAVAEVAGTTGADPADVWLAAWMTVAQRLAGADGAVVGLVDDRRSVEELEFAVGPYARVLPMSVDITADSTLRSLTEEVHRQRIAATAAAEACPEADFEIPLGFQHRGAPQAGDSPPDRTDCPLVLTVSGTGSSTSAALWADPAEIGADHAAQVGRTLAALLAAVTGDLDAPVSGASALDTDVDGPWLATLDGQMTDDFGATFIDRFEQQVADHPDRAAVSTDGAVLSYAELDHRSNAIARLLVDASPDRSVPVAIVMQRSLEQVVAVLAVMKTGAPHVCINPDQPVARIADQVAHCGASSLLTVAEMVDTLPPFDGTVLAVDRTDATGAGRVAVPVAPDDLAYIVYTSGSTGTPKGVAVTHRGLRNYVNFVTDQLIGADLADGWTFTLVTSLSTDLGNTSLYPALASGGCVSVVPLDVAMDPELFATYSREHPADVLKITPSHLEALLTADHPVLPRQLLITGGEALRWELVDRVRQLSDCRMVNHYGPSETTVGSLVFEVATASPTHRARPVVPIGKPIVNTRVRIVDQTSAPVAPGAPGELLLGGAGLARGYWRDEARTEESFPDDPLADGTGRYYRTGDLVRYLPDGTVEFIGRIDGQVKVRGFRVETGEIEASLRNHPEVQRAAVIQREDTPGDRRLVAYIVSPYSPGPTPSSLREYLKERLPEYMIPSAFVELDSLPLLTNGKLDRGALAPPTDDDVDGIRDYVAPTTETQRVVAEMFGELLGVEQVGATDDFFALGGHSLLATQAIARLRTVFEVELEVHLLFTAPTVDALAHEIDDRRALDEDDDLADLLPRDRRPLR